MNIEKFINIMNSCDEVLADSDVFKYMHKLSQEALKLTNRINFKYNNSKKIIKIMTKLTGKKVESDFTLFPPFYSDCGKNLHIGKNVFINSSCHFQDQGGIYIGDNNLIGHNVKMVTLNHQLSPSKRKNLLPKPIKLNNNIWVGSNSTILPGVEIGENSVIAAGAVVTKSFPSNVIIGGIPAKILKKIDN